MRVLGKTLSLLSDPINLRILEQLSQGPSDVTSLCEALGLKQPAMGHHLGLLRMVGVIKAVRQGHSVVYKRDSEVLRDVVTALADKMLR